MSVNFDSGSRKKKGPGFSAAIGLCLAAVCLVAAATAINSRSNKGSDDDYISEYVSQEGDSVWLGMDDTSGEEVYIETDSFIIDEPADLITDETADGSVIDTDSDSAAGADDAEAVFAELSEEEPPVTDELELIEDETVPAAARVSFRMPLNGNVIKEFSGQELVFCSTMGDWRVHNGVDISGTLDCEVYAAADGIVVDFVEDMLYGYTAIIRHEDDSTLYYCGLSSVPKVSAGLEVHAGDVIGYLGVVPGESEEEPHLHLSMMKDGAFVDPIKAMGL